MRLSEKLEDIKKAYYSANKKKRKAMINPRDENQKVIEETIQTWGKVKYDMISSKIYEKRSHVIFTPGTLLWI